MADLLPVAEARRQIVAALTPVDCETVPLDQALGRVLRANAVARVSHPPADVSAMDGYAVKADAPANVPLRVVGESAAGKPWSGTLGQGEAVRIFTGAHVPKGADAIAIQEDTIRDATTVTMNVTPIRAQHIRRAGQDFAAGDVILRSPRRLSARDIGLLAAMNLPRISVARRPRIGVLSTGDEVVLPGTDPKPGQIVSANGPGLCAFVRAHGGEAISLGVVGDTIEALRTALRQAKGLDLLVTTGGVSVGDYDLVARAMDGDTARIAFHRIAMRPGKPLLFGTIDGVPLLGLSGNPVSAMISAILFLGPALAKLQGLEGDAPQLRRAILGADIRANDQREEYLRATLRDDAGQAVAAPFPVQDAAMITVMATADALIIRPPHAPAARAGDPVDIIELGDLV